VRAAGRGSVFTLSKIVPATPRAIDCVIFIAVPNIFPKYSLAFDTASRNMIVLPL